MSGKLKIGILGTRGIPNHYGGFEQWAEQLSVGLVKKGCQVVVYNSHFHPYKQKHFNEVTIIKKWDPKKIGLASQFIYDLLCILNARKQHFDVIIQLGYTTSSVWAWLLPKGTTVLYNMDGIEWKRAKYKGILRSFLKWAEKLAVKQSDIVVADSKPIKEYLDKKFSINTKFIAYPAEKVNLFSKEVLKQFNLEADNYYLLIARFQPDNNLEMVIKGVLASDSKKPLVIVGDHNNRYGEYLKSNYRHKRILFLGRIYDKQILDALRYFSTLYFHGHSAGGTNPSLLEAIAASAVICAHNNEFSRSVLGEDSFYFNNSKEITSILNGVLKKDSKLNWIKNNLLKLRNHYTKDMIIDSYYKLFNP